MESKKNTPPSGVILAVGVIVALIIFYFALTALFPDLFHGLSNGEAAPVKPE